MVVAVVEASRMVVSLPKISLQKFKLAVFEHNWIRKGALLRKYIIILNDNNKLSLHFLYNKKFSGIFWSTSYSINH